MARDYYEILGVARLLANIGVAHRSTLPLWPGFPPNVENLWPDLAADYARILKQE